MNVKTSLAWAVWFVTVSCGTPQEPDAEHDLGYVRTDAGMMVPVDDADTPDADEGARDAMPDGEPVPAPVCGNGVVEQGEACDDGNTSNMDGCTGACVIEHLCCCGNGEVEPGEQCDDGNADDGDGCSSSCVLD